MSENSNQSEIPPKKQKLDDGDAVDCKDSKVSQERRFDGFETVRVLNENAQRKMICLEGKFAGKDEPAVVIVEKTPITEAAAKEMLSVKSTTDNILSNDIYGTFHLCPEPKLNTVKTTLIYPATEKHIAKYTAQDMHLIEESPHDYETITKPHILSQGFNLKWVHNIVAGRSEAERVVLRDDDADTGFVLLPDMKWDGRAKEDLYLVAIALRTDVLSMRELRACHLPLLCNIRDKGRAVIAKRYGVEASRLRVYLHYQPSYYHLHVHFTHLQLEAGGSGVERAHLLTDVIAHLQGDGEYYARRTLPCVLKAGDDLYLKLQEAHSQANSLVNLASK